MRNKVRMPIAIPVVFLWIGFVCSISFMEAWLKFQAPGVTMAIGLGIGRLVFGMLNKIEWVLALILIIVILKNTYLLSIKNLLLWLAMFVLVLQTIWLLPALDARAELLIQGGNIPNSNLHFIFILAEVLKISFLSIFGIKQYLNEYR